MTNQHFYASHALAWAVADTRKGAIDKLMEATDPAWARNCLKSGSVLSVFSCQVNVAIDVPYKISWFCPADVDWQDGRNDFVTYMTKTKYALMRDPSDALGVKIKKLEAELAALKWSISEDEE